jgi:hypothetical protein
MGQLLRGVESVTADYRPFLDLLSLVISPKPIERDG